MLKYFANCVTILQKSYFKSSINQPSSRNLLPAYIERSSLLISYQQHRSIELLMVLEMDFHLRGSKAETTGNADDSSPSYTIPDSSYHRLLFALNRGDFSYTTPRHHSDSLTLHSISCNCTNLMWSRSI